LALIASKFSPQTGFTSLIRFGETWEISRSALLSQLPIATVPNSSGYDGQFYAQIALDPLLLDPATGDTLDIPAYRARRILTPATAAAVGMGNPWWTLQAYALLNVACWLAFALVLYRSIPGNDWASFARWAGCMFGMGVLESARQSLVDLPALLLLAMAIDAHNRTQPSRSTIWLGFGNLAKESNLLGALALNLESFRWPFTNAKKIVRMIVAAIPVIAWSCYVSYRLPNSPEASGTGNFTWPLWGICQQAGICLGEIAKGNWDGRFSMGLLAIIGLSTQAWVLWRRPDFRSGWWRVGAAYSILMLVLGPWVWSGYWAACRALLPMTIAFNLLLPADNRSFWPLWILGNSALLHAIWRFL
jgi:hypothetical protein